MIKLTLQNAWAHKRRLIGTFLAVLLGVSFLSGTLVLGDTLRANFDGVFNEALGGIDVIVRPADVEGIDAEDDDGMSAQSLDASLASELGTLDGVRAAHAQISGFAQIIGADGEKIGGDGPPTIGGNWIDDDDLNPYRLAEGNAPQSTEEVVVNRSAAQDAGLEVGDTFTVLTPEPIEVTLTGITTFGDADGSGPVTFTAFTDAGAEQHLLREPGRASEILMAAEDGVSQDELAATVADSLAGTGSIEQLDVITGDAAITESNEQINDDFLGFLTTFLVVFAGIALLVATFSIYNTFSIIVAQRTRESALMRAIGATKRQVLTGTLIEALLIGVLASVIGLGVGLLFAGALKGMFDAFGLDLPAGGITYTSTSVAVALVAGIGVTLLAAIGPARRAGRVAPIEALRESSIEAVVPTRRRLVIGVAISVIGVVLMAVGVLGGGDLQLQLAGAGALGIVIGMVTLGPVAARPVARIVGAPMARFGGVTGELARENAIRNPRRTASTAAALMVGVAVVVLFSVMIASAAAFVGNSVDRTFGGDLVVSSGGFGVGTLPVTLADEAAALPDVAAAAGLGFGSISVDGDSPGVSSTEPAELSRLFDLGVEDGSFDDVSGTSVGIAIEEAERIGVEVGDQVSATFPDGAVVPLTIAATYEHFEIADSYVLDRELWAEHNTFVADVLVFVEVADGAQVSAVRDQLATLTENLGNPDIQDRDEYTEAIAGQLNQLLGLITVMLTLAIIIALMGIANTLALSVHERSRELGVLRAVGTTRRQVRRLVRWESVIISTFGTIGGIGLGIALGWGLVAVAFSDSDIPAFAIPVGQLAATVVVGIVAGILAAARPARRAAKRDPLASIAMT